MSNLKSFWKNLKNAWQSVPPVTIDSTPEEWTKHSSFRGNVTVGSIFGYYNETGFVVLWKSNKGNERATLESASESHPLNLEWVKNEIERVKKNESPS